MNWQQALIGLCLGFTVCCALGIVFSPGRRRNRRTGLPAPKYDERNSIATFKRMHQP